MVITYVPGVEKSCESVPVLIAVTVELTVQTMESELVADVIAVKFTVCPMLMVVVSAVSEKTCIGVMQGLRQPSESSRIALAEDKAAFIRELCPGVNKV